MARVVVSQLRNPFANLALETVLFRHPAAASEHLLYIYFNDPCIVIGRNQNPWAECDLRARVPLLRRRSGGGAVVHDAGNANFGVQFPRAEFSRSRHLDMIIDAFPQLALRLSPRNDLLVGDKKVSGSSYKIEKQRAYHHATLLLHSDLASLSKLLKPDEALQGRVTEGGGTESVRSPVTNTGLDAQEFIDGTVAAFKGLYGPADVEHATDSWITPEVEEEIEELQSWDWVFGKTPKFSLEFQGRNIQVERGIVTSGWPDMEGRPMPRPA